MPKAPILTRTLVYATLSDGTLHLLDWCLVSTVNLGTMVEPRLMTRPKGDIVDEDQFDSGYTQIMAVPVAPSGNYAFDQLAFSGAQWPHYRAYDPGVE